MFALREYSKKRVTFSSGWRIAILRKKCGDLSLILRNPGQVSKGNDAISLPGCGLNCPKRQGTQPPEKQKPHPERQGQPAGAGGSEGLITHLFKFQVCSSLKTMSEHLLVVEPPLEPSPKQQLSVVCFTKSGLQEPARLIFSTWCHSLA